MRLRLALRKQMPILILALMGCLFLLTPADAKTIHLRIIHINDLHGYAEPHRPYGSAESLGGVAYLAGRVMQLKAEKKIPTLLLAAGDMLQGNLWTNLNRGRGMIELMNLMRLDAMVVGNHEFDFGQEALRSRIAEAAFPILGANVAGSTRLKPYVIKKVGGLRVGILGVVTKETATLTHPANVRGVTFSSPEEACARYMPELRREADVIVVMSHIGYAGDLRLAERVHGLHAIIGGHSHTKLQRPHMVGNTAIVQAWEHGKALGVLDLTLRDGQVIKAEGRLEEIKPVGGEPDPGIAALVSRYAAAVDGAMGDIIGRSCADLNGEYVRYEETNLGNMVADVIRGGVGADIALTNAGSIRASVKKGDISLRHVYDVLPFGNYVVVMKLTGKQILRTLEHGLAHAGEGGGAFLQMSGLRVVYDSSAPAGNRVREARVGEAPLNLEQEYMVAVNDFMAAGGDGYDFLKSPTVAGDDDRGRLVVEMVADFIREKGEICPKTEGRIRQLARPSQGYLSPAKRDHHQPSAAIRDREVYYPAPR